MNNSDKPTDARPKKLTVNDLKKVIGGGTSPPPIELTLEDEQMIFKINQKMNDA